MRTGRKWNCFASVVEGALVPHPPPLAVAVAAAQATFADVRFGHGRGPDAPLLEGGDE